MTRIITAQEYRRILNEEDADFCDCCGGKYLIDGLVENVAMPDTEGVLHNGYTACHACSYHAEEGPCQPENLVAVHE